MRIDLGVPTPEPTYEVVRGTVLAIHLHLLSGTPNGLWGGATMSHAGDDFIPIPVPYPGGQPRAAASEYYVAFSIRAVGTTHIAIGVAPTCTATCPAAIQMIAIHSTDAVPQVSAAAIQSPPSNANAQGSFLVNCLTIPVAGALVSPNGEFVAGTDGTARRVAVYDLQGRLLASHPVAAGPMIRWLEDSSGISVSTRAPDGGSGSIGILSRSGAYSDTGLTGDTAALSPDGMYLASTARDAQSGTSHVEVQDRGGRPVAHMPASAAFLGWLPSGALIAAGRQLEIIQPSTGATKPLGAISGSRVDVPFGGPAGSPDGEVEIVDVDRGAEYAVSDAHVMPVPAQVVIYGTPIWTHGHQALAYHGNGGFTNATGGYDQVDLITSATTRTGWRGDGLIPQAVSEPWVIAADDQQLHAVQDQTGVNVPLGISPLAGRATAIAGQRFLVLNGNGRLVVVQPDAPAGPGPRCT